MTGAAHPLVVIGIRVVAGEVGPVISLRRVSRAAPVAAHRRAAPGGNAEVASLITSRVALPRMIGGPELVTLSGDSCGDAMAPHDLPDDLLCQADSSGYLRLGVTFPVEPGNLGDGLGDAHVRAGAASDAAHGAPPPMPENTDRPFTTLPPLASPCRGP